MLVSSLSYVQLKHAYVCLSDYIKAKFEIWGQVGSDPSRGRKCALLTVINKTNARFPATKPTVLQPASPADSRRRLRDVHSMTILRKEPGYQEVSAGSQGPSLLVRPAHLSDKLDRLQGLTGLDSLGDVSHYRVEHRVPEVG